MDKLGEALSRFRAENRLSQGDLAKKLGISQAHVSRLEKGNVAIPPHLWAKIQKLVKVPIDSHNFELSGFSDEKWRIAHFKYPEKISGDRVYLNWRNSPDRNWIMHCDAAGSDITASQDADSLTVAFDATVSALSLPGISPEAIYMALNKTIKNTKEIWRGEPSCNFISLSKQGEKVEYVCGGMPAPIFFDSKKGEAIRISKEHRAAPVGAMSIRDQVFSKVINMNRDDLFFCASDGFEEAFKRVSRVSLESVLTTLSKIQRGDADGIGWKLLKLLEEQTQHQRIADDISFVIVGTK